MAAGDWVYCDMLARRPVYLVDILAGTYIVIYRDNYGLQVSLVSRRDCKPLFAEKMTEKMDDEAVSFDRWWSANCDAVYQEFTMALDLIDTS